MTPSFPMAAYLKHTFKFWHGQSIQHLLDMNHISTISPLLQCPKPKLFNPLSVWFVPKVRYHLGETMLNLFNQFFVFDVVWRPRNCTILNMRPHKSFEQSDQ